MSHAFLVIAAILGCLALFGAGTYFFADPHWKTALQYTAWRWRSIIRTEWYSLRADLADLNMACRQSLSQRDPSPLLACRDSMLRARRPAATANPEGTDPAPAAGSVPAPTRADLPIPPPRTDLYGVVPVNGVYRGRQPRKTVHMIICDPAVTDVVPGYYRAYLAGWFRP